MRRGGGTDRRTNERKIQAAQFAGGGREIHETRYPPTQSSSSSSSNGQAGGSSSTTSRCRRSSGTRTQKVELSIILLDSNILDITNALESGSSSTDWLHSLPPGWLAG